jgi:hypothetical protein
MEGNLFRMGGALVSACDFEFGSGSGLPMLPEHYLCTRAYAVDVRVYTKTGGTIAGAGLQ